MGFSMPWFMCIPVSSKKENICMFGNYFKFLLLGLKCDGANFDYENRNYL